VPGSGIGVAPGPRRELFAVLLQRGVFRQAACHRLSDRAFDDAPDLTYDMAAEILFLIETLEKPR